MTQTATDSPALRDSEDSRLFSQEDESMVLAAALNGTGGEHPLVHRLLNALLPDEFYVEAHRTIWAVMGDLRDGGKTIDPLAIAAIAARRNQSFGGPDYLSRLYADPIWRSLPDQSALEAARRIRSASMMRMARDAFRKLAQAAQANQVSVDLILQAAADEITNIHRRSEASDSTMKRMFEHMLTATEGIITRQGTDETGDITGVQTLFPSIDAVLIALEGLTYIGARPSMGKTAFMLNLAENSAKQGRPTAIFELEMPGKKLAVRTLASKTGVTLHRLRSANDLADHEQDLLLSAVQQAAECPLYIDDTPGLTLPELRARVRAFATANPGAVVFIDYLQLILPPESFRGEMKNWVGTVSGALRELQRELGIPIVVLSQLNRGVEQRANRRPMMSDLRESGNIEQDASIIMFLYRDEVYNPDSQDQGIAEVIVAKNRDGEANVTRRLRFRGDVQLFEESIYAEGYA